MKFKINGKLYWTHLLEQGRSDDLEVAIGIVDDSAGDYAIRGPYVNENEPVLTPNEYATGVLYDVREYFGSVKMSYRDQLLLTFEERLRDLIDELGGEVVD